MMTKNLNFNAMNLFISQIFSIFMIELKQHKH